MHCIICVHTHRENDVVCDNDDDDGTFADEISNVIPN